MYYDKAMEMLAYWKVALYASFAWVFVYLDIPQAQFKALFWLMFIDTVLGVARQWSLDPSNISSDRGKKWLIKKIAILTLILGFAVAIKGNELDGGVFLTWVIAVFMAWEVYSMTRSVYIIATGKVVPEFNATAVVTLALINFLKNLIIKSAEKLKIKDSFQTDPVEEDEKKETP